MSFKKIVVVIVLTPVVLIFSFILGVWLGPMIFHVNRSGQSNIVTAGKSPLNITKTDIATKTTPTPELSRSPTNTTKNSSKPSHKMTANNTKQTAEKPPVKPRDHVFGVTAPKVFPSIDDNDSFSPSSPALKSDSKVGNYPLRIEVTKSKHTLTIYHNDQVVMSCLITTGKDDKENATPSGIYRITGIEYDPPWYPPTRVVNSEGLPAQIKSYKDYLPAKTKAEGNLNALGTVWISISWIKDWSENDQGWYEDSLGIHGTNEPDKIGGALGHGCIRMQNENAENLASWITEEGLDNTIIVIKTD